MNRKSMCVKIELTGWFDRGKRPIRAGVYQTRFDNQAQMKYSYWDGIYWYATACLIEDAISFYKDKWRAFYQTPQWRGILKGANHG